MFRNTLIKPSICASLIPCQQTTRALVAHGFAVRAGWQRRKSSKAEKSEGILLQLHPWKKVKQGRLIIGLKELPTEIESRPPPAPLRKPLPPHSEQEQEESQEKPTATATQAYKDASNQSDTLALIQTEDEIPQDEVNASIDALRPKTRVLSSPAHLRLLEKLETSFSFAQLQKYYREMLPSIDPVDPSSKPGQNDVVLVSKYRQGRSSLSRKLELLSNEVLDEGETIRDVSSRIVLCVWNVRSRTDLETIGEIEVRLKPWQAELLLHRNTNGQPNYHMLLASRKLSNAAALSLCKDTTCMRIVANQTDALNLMDTIKNKLIDANDHAVLIHIPSGKPRHALIMNAIAKKLGIAIQLQPGDLSRIYGFDRATVKTIGHAMASQAWNGRGSSDTVALAMAYPTGELRSCAQHLRTSTLTPFFGLQSQRVTQSRRAPITTLERMTVTKDESFSSPRAKSSSSWSDMIGILERELEKHVKLPSVAELENSECQWTAKICLLLHEGRETEAGSDLILYHQLGHVQQLLSYFRPHPNLERYTREVIKHFLWSPKTTNSSIKPWQPLDVKWYLQHGDTPETQFIGFRALKHQHNIELALPSYAADITTSYSTEWRPNTKPLQWLQDVSFVERRDDSPDGIDLDMVDRDGQIISTSDLSSPDLDRFDSTADPATTTPTMYRYQFTDITGISNVVPLDLLDKVEPQIADLLRSWPAGVTLQFRHKHDGARELHIVDTRACPADEEGMTKSLRDVVKASMIVTELLTLASEGLLPMHTHEQPLPKAIDTPVESTE